MKAQPDQIPEVFAAQYGELSDEELRLIYKDQLSLVEPAIIALNWEMARRGLNVDEELADDSGNLEPGRPYLFGKFLGGATILSGLGWLLDGALALSVGIIFVSVLQVVLGFGIYKKQKWAILLVEIGSAFAVLGTLFLAFTLHDLSALFIVLAAILISGLQLSYFWKRRDEFQ